MRILKSFRPNAHLRQATMRVILDNKVPQEKGEIVAHEIANIAADKLKVSDKKIVSILAYLLMTGLVDSTQADSKSWLFLTPKGKAYLESRTLIHEFWSRVESRIVNLSLVGANLILVTAFFAKDNRTGDALSSIKSEMQQIKTEIRAKELKISLSLDTTGFHKKDSVQGD